MHVFLITLTTVVIVLTVFMAVLTLGGILQIADDCQLFNRKSRFFALRVLFFAVFILTEVLFFLSIGQNNWNLTLLFGTLLVIMLSYYIWLWSKHKTDSTEKRMFFLVHLCLAGGSCLSRYLCNIANNYEWEHKEIYVVHSVKNNSQEKQADTLYIFNSRVITKPAN